MAGAGYKLFNTGDVLTAAQVNTYLMEQTVMVFADAAARTTALTGVVSEGMLSYLKDTNAVEVYNGSAWVSSDDPNAIQNTIVDAKGDLITATAADTPARLAVGSNGDTLVADSAATTGLRWTATPSASNPVLNSAFDVWQRGTSFSIAASTAASYYADRWQSNTSANQATTVSRQATNDTTNLPNIQYCLRFQRNSGQTGTTGYSFTQTFETANSIPFAGKTVTLSFYARAGANYSAASGALKAQLYSGTGTDQNIFNGFTGSATPIDSTATLTTTWQRFSYSATLSSSITQLAVVYVFTPVGTASTNDYFEITGVQLDVGSVALPFRRTGGTLQGELAACQRYYYRYNNSGNGSAIGTSAYGLSTTVVDFVIPFPVVQRVTPTSIDSSGVQIYNAATATQYTTGTVTNAPSVSAFMGVARYTHGTGVFTAGTTYYPNGGTSAYVGFSAEL